MRQTQPRKKRETLEEVSRAALQALAELVPRPHQTSVSALPIKPLLERMYQAVLDAHPAALGAILDTMQHARISRAEIVEIYVPAVARRLGESWLDDRLAFGAVTIGAARLQAAVRRMDRDIERPLSLSGLGRPTFVVGVGQGEQHTLGACVLASMLRQRGYGADLEFDLTPSLIGKMVKRSAFAGVLLCASDVHRVELLRDLVVNVRHNSRGTPVIIGGPVLEHSQDILSTTQADLATSDLVAALQFCNLGPKADRGGAASNMSSEPYVVATVGGAAG